MQCAYPDCYFEAVGFGSVDLSSKIAQPVFEPFCRACAIRALVGASVHIDRERGFESDEDWHNELLKMADATAVEHSASLYGNQQADDPQE